LLFPLMLFFLKIRSRSCILVNTYGDLVESIADISYVNAIPIRIAHRFSQSGLQDSFAWRLAYVTYDIWLKLVEGIQSSTIVLTNSTFLQGILKNLCDLDSKVIYPPVKTCGIEPRNRQTQRRNLVVTVSRFRPGKNLDIIPQIAKMVQDADFTIVGTTYKSHDHTVSRLLQSIEALGVGDRVRLLLNQSRDEISEIMFSAKVFLHTQKTEAFGMAIVEAMSSGCVPIVPKTGGPWHDILGGTQGRYGYAYENLEEAAATIRSLVANEELRNQVSARAKELAQEFHNLQFDHEIQKIIAVLIERKRHSYSQQCKT
jgi:glycosyltransferase involved in cell wall biosynthesis